MLRVFLFAIVGDMKNRSIEKVFTLKPTMEGAGVRLRRGFGFHEAPHFDPFLMFDDFTGTHEEDYRAGFPWHPHRGIETVTYILKGSVAHKDSIGNEGMIGAGDVQWMSAGSGIVHQEMPQVTEEGVEGFQLWMNLPRTHKMSAPRYQEIKASQIPTVADGGAAVKVVAGAYGNVEGPIDDISGSPTYFDVSLKEGGIFSMPISESKNAFVYLFAGDLVFGSGTDVEQWLRTGEIALLGGGDTFAVRAGKGGARFLFIAGTPIGEPIAWHGPIVMNTDDEIKTALQELQEGTFIKEH